MINKIEDNEKHLRRFLDYPIFREFIHYAIYDLNPTIYTNESETVLVLNSMVAYFILGSPNDCNPNEILEIIPKGSWIITIPSQWNKIIEGFYKDELKVMDRILFDSSTINLRSLESLKAVIPKELAVVPISKEHLEDSIIVEDVTSRFFTKRDFLEYGFGFALVDENNVVQGFSISNFPVLGNKAELHFRIGFSDENKYRRKGYGQTLAVMFIEECFKRGIEPIWDAANPKSAQIAKKIGYTEKLKWKVYIV